MEKLKQVSDFDIREKHVDNSTASFFQQVGKKVKNDDDMLCAMASTRIHKTHLVLKAPFFLLAILSGLWLRPWKNSLQYILVAVGILINCYIFLGNIAVYKICRSISDNAAEKLSPWLCYGPKEYNETSRMLAGVFHPVLLSRMAFGFSQFSGYVLMVYSVLIALERRDDFFVTLRIALILMKRSHWIRLNVQIVISCVFWLAFLICDVKRAEHYIPHDHAVIWTRVGNWSMWLYIGTPCFIFAVITYAMESLIDTCFEEIKEIASGTLEDVIAMYRQLCQSVFNTVNALRYWFVFHWISFGMCLIFDMAIGLEAVEQKLEQRENPVLFWIFSLAFLGVVFHPFLYPSIRAASLTSSSADMLERLNFVEQRDWRDDHPLRGRRDMNDFLIFANQIRCGFRIGRLTFDNGLAWLSAFFAIFSFTIKLM